MEDTSSSVIRKIWLLTAFSAALGVVGAVARVLLLRKYYVAEDMMYVSGSIWPDVFGWCFAILIIAEAAAAFLFSISLNNTGLPEESSPVVFSSTISCFMLAGMLLIKLIYGRGSGVYGAVYDTLTVLMMIVALPFMAYFLMGSIFRLKTDTAASATGFASVIWTALCLLILYFERNCPMNNPVRVMSQLSYIALMLYFLCELRTRIKGETRASYFALGAVAVSLTLASELPKIVMQLFFNTVYFNDTVFTVIKLCFTAYIITRLCSYKSKTAENQQ